MRAGRNRSARRKANNAATTKPTNRNGKASSQIIGATRTTNRASGQATARRRNHTTSRIRNFKEPPSDALARPPLAYSSCARSCLAIVQGTVAETDVQAESRLALWTPAEATATTLDNVDVGSSYVRISAGSNTRTARVIAVIATAAMTEVTRGVEAS